MASIQEQVQTGDIREVGGGRQEEIIKELQKAVQNLRALLPLNLEPGSRNEEDEEVQKNVKKFWDAQELVHRLFDDLKGVSLPNNLLEELRDISVLIFKHDYLVSPHVLNYLKKKV